MLLRSIFRLFQAGLAVLVVGLLPLAGAHAAELTIYTYDAFAADYGPGPLLKKGFEAQCSCMVIFVATDSSVGALRRAQLEGASSPADLIIGLDGSISEEAEATGLFAAPGVSLEGLSLPPNWQPGLFVPVDQGYFAFVYDKRVVAEPPHSFEELAALPDDFKIVIEDPRSDTPGLGLVLWIRAAYGDRAPEIWAGLKPHILTVARSWSDAYGLFLKGEADMVLSYTTSPAYHLIAENDDHYAYAPFSEGHYAQVELAGLLKSSKNPELARQFLAYLITGEAQAILPETNWMYPVRASATPAGFDAVPLPDKILLLDDHEAGSMAKAWSDEALDALR